MANSVRNLLLILTVLTVVPSASLFSQPVAGFTTDRSTACIYQQEVIFTDASTDLTGTATYSWDFGAGAYPSTATGPGPHVVRYFEAGAPLVSLTVTDDAGTDDFTASPVTVLGIPTITEGEGPIEVSCNEDTPPGSFSFVLHASDPENDIITWSVNRLPSHGTATAAGTGTSKTVIYTPSADFNGFDAFEIYVTDNICGGTLLTVGVTVNPVNDAPSFTKGNDVSTDDNSGSVTVPSWATSVSAGPADEAGQSLSFNVSTDNSSLFSVQPAISGDGTLTFTPAVNTSGTALVTVYLTDSGGTDNGGTDRSATRTFNITVSDVTPPAPPQMPDMESTSDSGVSGSDNITKDNTPSFVIGGLDPLTTVTVYANGTLIGSANTASGENSVTVTASAPLADGSYEITARQEDASGNLSSFSAPMSPQLVIDTEAPVITLLGSNPMIIDLGSVYTEPGANVTEGLTAVITGGVNPSMVGDNLVYYNASDVAGNAALQVTRTVSVYENKPVASFTAAPSPAACNQEVSFDASASHHLRPDRSIVSYSWDFGDGSPVVQGVAVTHAFNRFGIFRVTLTVTDNNIPAKTASASSEIMVSLGNVPPVAVPGGAYVTDIDSDVNMSGVGSYDLNASCGDYIVRYKWLVNGVTELLGPAVTLTAAQLQAMGLGVYPVRLTVTDSFGAESYQETTLTVSDLTVPAAPAAPDLLASSDSGISDSDNITKDKKPSFLISGVEPSATVSVYAGVTLLGSIPVPAGQNYVTFNVTSPMPDGTYQISCTQKDGSGNVSSSSPSMTPALVIDATPPVITLNGSNPLEIKTGAGYTEPGAAVSEGLAPVITGTPEINIPGTYQVSYDATDIAGNQSLTVIRTVNVVNSPSGFMPAWWPGNGTDHMNLYVISATLDGSDLQPGDEIGIFDGSLCVGVGFVNAVITETGYMSVIVSRDDPETTGIDGFIPGNAISYKIWDESSHTLFSYVDPVYSDGEGVFTSGASATLSLKAVSPLTQSVSLRAGWNIISFNVLPDNMSLVSIVKPLRDAGTLVKVQDEAGNAIEQLPPPIGWIDNIGLMKMTEGYKIRVTVNTVLQVTGKPAGSDINIPLKAGWNIIGFPFLSEHPARQTFDTLITAGTLIKVQDEQGNAIEQLPPPIGWIDNILKLKPGEGYKVRTNTSTSLTISGGK